MSNKNRLVHYRLPTKQYVAEEQVPILDPNTVALLHFDESTTKDESEPPTTKVAGF